SPIASYLFFFFYTSADHLDLLSFPTRRLFRSTFEHGTVQHGDQLGAVFAVGVFRLDGHVQLIARLLAFQGLLQAGDDIAAAVQVDRKSTRLNSSHVKISYAVFCLKKKKNITLN